MKYLLLGMIGVGILMAFFIGWERHQVEQANKKLEVTVDWSQVKDLAGRENISEEAVLAGLKENITGVLIKEPTLNDLKNAGQVLVKTGTEMLWELKLGTGTGRLPVQNEAAAEIHEDWNYLIFSDSQVMNRVSRNLELKTGSKAKSMVHYYLQADQGVIPVLGTSLTSKDLSNMGLGFDEKELKLISSLDLDIIPQIRSWRTVNENGLDFVFGQFKDLPVSAVFFNDSDLPGVGLPAPKQNDAFESLAKHIEGLGVPVGMVEFFPQKGLATVAKYLDKNVVRLHSIPEDEMSAMTQTKAVDRFTLAASERDIRVLFVRFFPDMGLHETKLYLEELQSSLQGKGFIFGKPESFGSLPFSRIYLLVITLAVAGGGMLLFRIVGLEKWGLVLGVLGFLGTAGLLFIGQVGLARKGLALLAVIIFPTLSVTWYLREKPSGVIKSIWLFIKATLVSLIGAVLTVGLLGDKAFMYTLDQFMGVKIAHLVPVMLIIFIFWFLKDRGGKPWKKLLKLLDYPVTVKYVVLLGVLAVVLLVYIMRTGNENAAVSAWELALRARLTDLLAVRPRTKEFLIGHPLMLLMFYLGYRDKYLPVLLVAVIGQVSIVNTFAHIHTPLLISLMRAFNGLWLGIILGLVLIGVYKVGKIIMEKWQLTMNK